MHTELAAEHEYLTVAQAADLLGIHDGTVRRKLRRASYRRCSSAALAAASGFRALLSIPGFGQVGSAPMPRAKKEPPQLDPNVVYTAWQSFTIEIDGIPVDVQRARA